MSRRKPKLHIFGAKRPDGTITGVTPMPGQQYVALAFRCKDHPTRRIVQVGMNQFGDRQLWSRPFDAWDHTEHCMLITCRSCGRSCRRTEEELRGALLGVFETGRVSDVLF